MADIKGMTIELGADTTKVSQSLSQVNKEIKSTENELKKVDNLLKLDPNNTELLNQRQILLNKSIADSNVKLDQLTKKENALKDAGVDENSKEFRELQREIFKTNNIIDKNSKSLKKNDTQKKKSVKVDKEFIKSAGAVAGAVMAVATVIAGVGKTLIDWAVEGAKSASLNTQEYSKFADTLYALQESSTKAKTAIASLLLPALEELGNKGVESLNKITEATKSGNIEEIANTIGGEITSLIEDISKYAPDFVYGIVKGILIALPQALPTLIEGIVALIPEIVNAVIESLPGVVTAIFNSVDTLLISSVNAIGEELKRLFSKSGLNLGISLVNGIIGGLNNLAHIKIPGLTMFGKKIWDDVDIQMFNIPTIPMLAKGGIVKNGTAIVGEAGAELLTVANGQTTVQPLTNNTTNNNYYGGGEQTISINFTGSLSQLARILQPEIAVAQNREGTSLIGG